MICIAFFLLNAYCVSTLREKFSQFFFSKGDQTFSASADIRGKTANSAFQVVGMYSVHKHPCAPQTSFCCCAVSESGTI